MFVDTRFRAGSYLIAIATFREFMKYAPRIAVLAILAACCSHAQQLPPPQGATTQSVSVADGTQWTVEVGPNGRTWTDSQGHHIEEMGTGMNFWDGQEFSPSNPSFQITPDGSAVVANQLQYKVQLAADINTQNAVSVVTPDGLTLNSTPVGIALFDSASGAYATIATITNCTGSLVNSNQVVYHNAFAGLCADVVYTISCGSFQQDVVINGYLNVANYGFPTNTTRIQILSEFYQPPTPQKIISPIYVENDEQIRQSMVSPDFMDQTIGFGEFVMGPGRAYTAASATNYPGGAPVGKQFVTVTNSDNGSIRTFLVESVAYPSIRDELDVLPECNGQTAAAGTRPAIHKTKLQYAAMPSPRPGKSAALFSRAPGLARADLPAKKGVTIDYIASIGGTLSSSTTFKGDTTYFISSTLTCNGAVLIEGGAIFKFPRGTSIQLNGSVVLTTAPFREAIFTGGDDNSVGDKLNTTIWSGYTGTLSSTYANPALSVVSTVTLAYLRFAYAQTAILSSAGFGTSTVANSQFVQCVLGIQLNGSGSGSSSPFGLNLNNCLLSHVGTAISTIGPIVAEFNQCTVDNCNPFVSGTKSNELITVTGTNSIFANGSSLSGTVGGKSGTAPSFNFLGNVNGFYSFPQFGNGQVNVNTSPFQQVGAGNYYLVPGIGLQAVGTTNIDSGTLASLAQKTTSPPEILSNTTTSASMVLYPLVQRNTGPPDLGYHYDPVDWLVDNYTVTNAVLEVQPGTVIASYNDPGIVLQDGSTLVSIGTPIAPIWYTRYQTVGEQSVSLGTSAVAQAVSISSAPVSNSPPTATLQFSKFSSPAGGGSHLIHSVSPDYYTNILVRECEFWGGSNTLSGPASGSVTATLVNNLFVRAITLASNNNSSATLLLTNNLFYGGNVSLTQPTSGSTWAAYNNAFDSSTNTAGSINNGYNAYLNGSGRLTPTNLHDVVLLSSLAYQTGPLGTFYQPATSSLINTGSVTANLVGLFHYTTTTNEVKETNSVVDIGYHYVAVTNGVPISSDGDGVPDYVKDVNGNGLYDSGSELISWLTFGANDYSLYVEGRNLGVTNAPTADTANVLGLQVYTPLQQ
jgi:hypothetical protein